MGVVMTKKILRGKDLVAGKMYTLHNCGTIWFYLPATPPPPGEERFSILGDRRMLFPLEPFVFLGRQNCASDFTSGWYHYKLLTGQGVVGWLELHDEDLEALDAGFSEYTEE
jgi:hypothetical protein